MQKEGSVQKSPILYKKLTNMAAHQGKLVIGILGTHKGCGVTHLGIMLAHYLSDYMGYRTALLECYPQKDIQQLQNYIYQDDVAAKELEVFKIQHVSYHRNVKEQNLPEVIGGEYDGVILDLGSDFARNRNEFLRCDKRIVVSSLSAWKRHELDQFIKNSSYIKSSSQWIYMTPFSQNRDIKEASRDFHREIYGIPYEADPFTISKSSLQLFQKLI